MPCSTPCTLCALSRPAHVYRIMRRCTKDCVWAFFGQSQTSARLPWPRLGQVSVMFRDCPAWRCGIDRLRKHVCSPQRAGRHVVLTSQWRNQRSCFPKTVSELQHCGVLHTVYQTFCYTVCNHLATLTLETQETHDYILFKGLIN